MFYEGSPRSLVANDKNQVTVISTITQCQPQTNGDCEKWKIAKDRSTYWCLFLCKCFSFFQLYTLLIGYNCVKSSMRTLMNFCFKRVIQLTFSEVLLVLICRVMCSGTWHCVIRFKSSNVLEENVLLTGSSKTWQVLYPTCLSYCGSIEHEINEWMNDEWMSVDFQWTTWRYIPEDRTLHNHCCDNSNPTY
jgi:hypothetical protein